MNTSQHELHVQQEMRASYVNRGLIYGMFIGLLIGVLTDHIAIGLALGMLIGLVVGSTMDERALDKEHLDDVIDQVEP